jgi:putative aminopeptidase FrvX
MIAEVARLLHERKVELPFSLYVVNAVQEEIGLRGAQMIVERIRPNAAIVTDVCHDTQSPMYKKIDSGDLSMGKGPVLSIGPMIQQNLLKLIVEAANEKKIPFQRQAASRATGTDTDAFAYNTGGVASALISLPMRYMHTTVETVDKVDVEAVIRLIFHSLEKIQNGHDFRYLK